MLVAYAPCFCDAVLPGLNGSQLPRAAIPDAGRPDAGPPTRSLFAIVDPRRPEGLGEHADVVPLGRHRRARVEGARDERHDEAGERAALSTRTLRQLLTQLDREA